MVTETGQGEPPLQLWGGAECTVNRIGDRFLDQFVLTGHHERISDLDRFAALGISAMRYPVLWERVAPRSQDEHDWGWTDERLNRLRELGMRPIAGLVHHGSGPAYTSLLDPEFPAGLARYAAAVAERYPWIQDYTPVNEPLTTARFSGLYGHWYPHGRDGSTFARCLLAQCRGVVLAMEAVRRVTPEARLVQTEDLGYVHSTPLLAYQAEYENHRRWLSLDLLCGRVDSAHPLRGWLLGHGVSVSDLAFFLEHPCPPQIVGVNHYLSSERFLDERTDLYPSYTHGGNGRHRYADVLAARVLLEGAAGPHAILRGIWDRYQLPIALTEVHNGCTREEQMRWFLEVWRTARALQAEGVDVRAVTAWSLLGAAGWDRLVTGEGRYEPGVFDIRSDPPRSTAMAPLLQALSAGKEVDHPVLAQPGWWQRADRFIFGHSISRDGVRAPAPARSTSKRTSGRPLLITGASGTLGRAFARACQQRGLPYVLTNRSALDIADPDSVHDAMDTYAPWAVISAAGYARIDRAEEDRTDCWRDNVDGAAVLAEICFRRDIRLVTFSSDQVFDGRKGSPYTESDRVSPLNFYGNSKAVAEREVLERCPHALIVRSGAFFSPWNRRDIVVTILRALLRGAELELAGDQTVSPTYVPDLTHAVLDLLIDGERGIWHLSNTAAVTWEEVTRRLAQRAGLSPEAISTVSMPSPAGAVRPTYSVLGTERGCLLPSLDDALDRFFNDCEVDWRVEGQIDVDSRICGECLYAGDAEALEAGGARASGS